MLSAWRLIHWQGRSRLTCNAFDEAKKGKFTNDAESDVLRALEIIQPTGEVSRRLPVQALCEHLLRTGEDDNFNAEWQVATAPLLIT